MYLRDFEDDTFADCNAEEIEEIKRRRSLESWVIDSDMIREMIKNVLDEKKEQED